MSKMRPETAREQLVVFDGGSRDSQTYGPVDKGTYGLIFTEESSPPEEYLMVGEHDGLAVFRHKDRKAADV